MMQSKETENVTAKPTGWLSGLYSILVSLLILIGGLSAIFVTIFILIRSFDSNHPTAIKILKEIEERVRLEGQVNLSSTSEQFDEICAFQQDDSDDGFALMDMNNLLSKRKISLQNTDGKLPKNPQRIILFIRNKTAFAVFNGEWAVYYMMLKGREIEEGSVCKPWANSIITTR